MNQNNINNTDFNKVRLAERCVQTNKRPILLKEVYAFLTDNVYTHPAEVKAGRQLTIICRARTMKAPQTDLDLGAASDEPVHWEIPSVVSVEWIQDHIVIESRTYMFSTLDFTTEYQVVRSER